MKSSTTKAAVVYLVTFLQDPTKIYVGKTILPLKERWEAHLYEARHQSPRRRTHLHRAIAKHGADAFKVEILERHASEEEAVEVAEIAMEGIYFGEDHKAISKLWRILRVVAPDIAAIAERDTAAAWRKWNFAWAC